MQTTQYKKLPTVTVDVTITVAGRCFPEVIDEFHNKMLGIVNDYKVAHKDSIVVVFNLEYINSCCTKAIFTFLKALEEIYQAGTKLTVNWYYEEDDDAMAQLGLDLKDLVSYELNILTI